LQQNNEAGIRRRGEGHREAPVEEGSRDAGGPIFAQGKEKKSMGHQLIGEDTAYGTGITLAVIPCSEGRTSSMKAGGVGGPGSGG